MNRSNKFKNDNVIIKCWTGKILFQGPVNSPGVDKVLDANRCDCGDDHEDDLHRQMETCPECDDTGFSGDFEVNWEDESDKDTQNVYEYINY